MREFRYWNGWDRFLGAAAPSIGSLVMAMVFIALLSSGPSSDPRTTGLIVFFLVVTLLAAPLMSMTALRMWNEKLQVEQGRLTFTDRLGRLRQIPEDQIRSLQLGFNAGNLRQLVIWTPAQQIAIHATLPGFDELIDLLKAGEFADRFQ